MSRISVQRWLRPTKPPTPGALKNRLATKHLDLAAKGDLAGVRGLVRDHPEFLNRIGPHNRTLLWEATRKGRFEVVTFLVESGAESNVPGRYNNESRVLLTPYCAALYYKRDRVADYLRTKSAPPDLERAAFLGHQKDVLRRLAKSAKLIHEEDSWDAIYYMPLLAFAVAGGHEILVKELIKRGARIRPYSLTLLNLAARIGRLDLIDLLVAHRADARTLDPGVLVDVGDLACFTRLVELGAPVSGPGLGGYPALAYVVRADKGARLDKVEVLINHGAEVNERGPKGRTALHLATAAGFKDIAALLRVHGADENLKDEGGKTPADLAPVENASHS
ncbi:MAG: ankyrin repeat domain-containing protein [Pseudomonadota bacterium]